LAPDTSAARRIVRESGRTAPPYPSIFIKPATSVAGHDHDVAIPTIAQDGTLDYEGELVSLPLDTWDPKWKCPEPSFPVPCFVQLVLLPRSFSHFFLFPPASPFPLFLFIFFCCILFLLFLVLLRHYPPHVALVWLIQKCAIPITGISNVERLADAVAVTGKSLTNDEMKYLEESYQPKEVEGHR
jgi:hypothetical protein